MAASKAAKTTKDSQARRSAKESTESTPSTTEILLAGIQAALDNPVSASPQTLLGLQRKAGNRAVSRLIQTKLKVGPASDKYEHEADRVAEQVTSPAPTQPVLPKSARPEDEVQTKRLAAGITPLVQRQQDEDEDPEDDEELQTKRSGSGAGFEVSGQVEDRLRANKGSGSTLSTDVRSQMESRFGASFDGVRVHSDGEAASLNQDLKAQAFTHGSDIYFGSGKYNPQSTDGQRLLAHELTHVVQQGGANTQAVQRKDEDEVAEPQVSAPTNVRMGGVGVSDIGSVRERMGHMGYDPKQVKMAGGPDKNTEKRGKEATGAENISADVVATNDEMQDPVKLLKTYREQAANYVRQAGRHKFKIERYTRFFEADFQFVVQKAQQVKSLEGAVKQITDKKQKKKMEKTLTGARQELGEDPSKAVPDASNRVAMGHQAGAVADSEMPLVDYAYDELKRLRHDVQVKDTRGRFSKDPTKRQEHYEKQQSLYQRATWALDAQGREPGKKFNKKKKDVEKRLEKHTQRVAVFGEAKGMLAQAGRLLGQAKLSEAHMAVKRKQLKVQKAVVKGQLGRAVSFARHLFKKGAVSVGSAAVSLATFGFVEMEQEKTKGGYASERRTVLGWNNWKREIATLKQVLKAKPYGKVFTWVHTILQGFSNLVLKPLRNFFSGVAITTALLSFIPGAAFIFGPIAALSSIIAAGLIAAKIAVDAILTIWTSLALLFNKNPRSTDILRGQAVSQLVETLGGGVSLGGSFAAPALSNLAGGKYKSTLDVATSGKSVTNMSLGESGAGSFSNAITNASMFGAYAGHQAAVMGAKGGTTLGAIGVRKGVTAVTDLEMMGAGGAANFRMNQEREHMLNKPEGGRSNVGKFNSAKSEDDTPNWMKQGGQEEVGTRLEARQGTARKAGSQLKALSNKMSDFVGKSNEVEQGSGQLAAQVEKAKEQEGVKEQLQPADGENVSGVVSGSSEAREGLASFQQAIEQSVGVAKVAESGKDPDLS